MNCHEPIPQHSIIHYIDICSWHICFAIFFDCPSVFRLSIALLILDNQQLLETSSRRSGEWILSGYSREIWMVQQNMGYNKCYGCTEFSLGEEKEVEYSVEEPPKKKKNITKNKNTWNWLKNPTAVVLQLIIPPFYWCETKLLPTIRTMIQITISPLHQKPTNGHQKPNPVNMSKLLPSQSWLASHASICCSSATVPCCQWRILVLVGIR